MVSVTGLASVGGGGGIAAARAPAAVNRTRSRVAVLRMAARILLEALVNSSCLSQLQKSTKKRNAQEHRAVEAHNCRPRYNFAGRKATMKGGILDAFGSRQRRRDL